MTLVEMSLAQVSQNPYTRLQAASLPHLADDVGVDVHAEYLWRVDRRQQVHVSSVLVQAARRRRVVRAGRRVRVP